LAKKPTKEPIEFIAKAAAPGHDDLGEELFVDEADWATEMNIQVLEGHAAKMGQVEAL
jgi:hypothetical protein